MTKRALAAVVVATVCATAPAARAQDPQPAANELPPDVPLTPPSLVRPSNRRDPGELVLLYFTGIGWAGSISFFVDGLAHANNAYAGASAFGILLSPVTGAIGVALPTLVDIAFDRRPGAAQTVSSAMLLGLGEGIALNEYFSNRTDRSFHTYTKDTAWVFGGLTAGLAAGFVLAAVAKARPGRAAWVETTGLFSGIFAGSIVGAASRTSGYPDFTRDARRDVGITAAIAGLAGIGGGVLSANALSPTMLRVHLVDAGWIFGTLVPAAACIGHCSTPDAFEAMAIGSGLGFATAFVATAFLPKDKRTTSPSANAPPISAYAMPVAGGFQLGVSGAL